MAELKTYEADCVDCGSTLEIDESELANEIDCPECGQGMNGIVAADGALTFAAVDEDEDDDDTCELCGELLEECDCLPDEDDDDEDEDED